MSVGRDIRTKDLVMRDAPVGGGLEPELLPESRQSVLAELGARATAYTPEWTDRSADDAGTAVVRVHATLAVAAHTRLNRIPRRLALDYLRAAGVQPLAASPAKALGAVEVAGGVAAPVEVAEGSVFTTPAGPTGPELETEHGCSALPGHVGSVAVLADGWLTLDRGDDLGGLPPFGPRPKSPAELWLGLETTVAPAGTLTIAVELALPPGRPTASAAATQPAAERPLLRWEAIGTTGPVELAVDLDETRGLDQSGVVASACPRGWAGRRVCARARPRVRRCAGCARGCSPRVPARGPARPGAAQRCRRAAPPGRSVARSPSRSSASRPAGRRTGWRRSRSLPGSVVLDITEPADGAGRRRQRPSAGRRSRAWRRAQPDDRVFVLDPADGTLTFGDGLHGRAVPEGYRNVVARSVPHRRRHPGLPGPATCCRRERSVPDLTGLRVATITTGSPAEPARRPAAARPAARSGPAQRAVSRGGLRRGRWRTPGRTSPARYRLPGVDPATGTPAAGTVGVVVVPRTLTGDTLPVPAATALAAVADHLARPGGRGRRPGRRGRAALPRVAVQGLLVGVPGADLAALTSAARDRIDAWLDPLVGGDGTGWPFGGPVRWNELVRMLLAVVPDLKRPPSCAFG